MPTTEGRAGGGGVPRVQVLLRRKEAEDMAGGQAGEGSSHHSGLQPTGLSLTESKSRKGNPAVQGSSLQAGTTPQGQAGRLGSGRDTDLPGPPGPLPLLFRGQGGRKTRVIRVTAGQPGREANPLAADHTCLLGGLPVGLGAAFSPALTSSPHAAPRLPSAGPTHHSERCPHCWVTPRISLRRP